jgi:hypothetical protein
MKPFVALQAEGRTLVVETEDAVVYAVCLNGETLYEVFRRPGRHLCRTYQEALDCAEPPTWETWLAPGDCALVGRLQEDGSYRFQFRYVEHEDTCFTGESDAAGTRGVRPAEDFDQGACWMEGYTGVGWDPPAPEDMREFREVPIRADAADDAVAHNQVGTAVGGVGPRPTARVGTFDA